LARKKDESSNEEWLRLQAEAAHKKASPNSWIDNESVALSSNEP